jgi:pantoate--beta-alanine ligase
MILFKKVADLQRHLDKEKEAGKTIGFAPTMGALHEGHLSLIESSRANNSITVCSIFVNPAQFNDPADFEKYPVTIEKDIALLEAAGTSILFLPTVAEVYPEGASGNEYYDLGYLETILEGKYRPGHFQGVCKVMNRLLNIVKPHNLYLGQKDYQQCMVITKLIELMGQKDAIGVNICPTLRETDGLAMSSRNTRLNEEERAKAPAIYAVLNHIKKSIKQGSLQALKKAAFHQLTTAGFKPDYIEIGDADTLQIVDEWDGEQKLVAVVAAFLNEVRLIDNMVLGSPPREK